jgi:hypothetical protein
MLLKAWWWAVEGCLDPGLSSCWFKGGREGEARGVCRATLGGNGHQGEGWTWTRSCRSSRPWFRDADSTITVLVFLLPELWLRGRGEVARSPW